MIFKEPIGMQNPRDMAFDDITIWIQLHNLPFACMNPKSVSKIAEQVGKVEEIDVSDGGNCLGQFARVRVTRPISKPLQRCVRIAEDSTKDTSIILILYERLPDFCLNCGCVGHVLRHCKEALVDEDKRAFGPWLRAKRVVETRRLKGKDSGGEAKQDRTSQKLLLETPQPVEDDNHSTNKDGSLEAGGDGEENNDIRRSLQNPKNDEVIQRHANTKVVTMADEVNDKNIITIPEPSTRKSWKKRARATRHSVGEAEPKSNDSGRKRAFEGFTPQNKDDGPIPMELGQSEAEIGRSSKKKKQNSSESEAENVIVMDNLSAEAAGQPPRLQ